MRFHTELAIDKFDFFESHISDIQITEGIFHIILDDVKILPENPCNLDIRTMRTNGLVLKLTEPLIICLTEEGYKTYNADGQLMNTTKDREVSKEEYNEIMGAFADGYIYSLTCEEMQDYRNYSFVIDATNEHTYSLLVQAKSDWEEWDRFLNL